MYKFMNNLKKKALIRLQENYYATIYNQIKDIRIDYIFIISIDFDAFKFYGKNESPFSTGFVYNASVGFNEK